MKIQVINAPANEETLVRKHVSLFAHERNICCGNIFCFRETNNVSDFSRNILFPQQMFPHLCAEETMFNGFCGRLGCISLIEVAQTSVFSEKVLGLPGKETFLSHTFARPSNILGGNVSSFAGAFTAGRAVVYAHPSYIPY